MPRLIESSREFLLDSALPPYWATDMPCRFFNPEISHETARNVVDGVPHSHPLHVLDAGVFHSSSIVRAVIGPDSHDKRSYRPLNLHARF